jgi:hypothetical protein
MAAEAAAGATAAAASGFSSVAIIGLTFARERNRQFVAANLMQGREIDVRKLPQHVGRHMIVGVPKDIADRGDS